MKKQKLSKVKHKDLTPSSLRKSETFSSSKVQEALKEFVNDIERQAKYGDGTGKIFYPHDQLMTALYWAWDAFERVQLGMFLVNETLENVLKNKPMSGDKITLGVRKLEWVSGNRPILLNFTGEPIEKTEKYEVFKNPFNQVPIYVYIYEDDPCISSPNQVFYEHEYFMVPNPPSRFIELYGNSNS